ncbi:uncharacterized protein LOC121855721 [Homarus americanus]|uniref:uncharacterized protein LOC121855721 n=1 Tax=Homarus americanus TaxID=6706 RepID=UPI001C450E0F|nr:uncharacterized protein LOC121855721 [Homarus americanus]
MNRYRRHSFHSTETYSKPRLFSSFKNSSVIHDNEDQKENTQRKRLLSDSAIIQFTKARSFPREAPWGSEQKIVTPAYHELPIQSEECEGVKGVSEQPLDQSPPVVLRRRTCSAIEKRRSPDQRFSETQLVKSVFARHRIIPATFANYRYTNALEIVLPEVLRRIFFYKYGGPCNLTLEEYFTQNLQYSREKLKSIFGSTLRKKLNVKPTELTCNDVSLWYKLLQVGCNLAPPESMVWYEDGFDNDSLEHILWELKEMRNVRVHGETSACTLTIPEYLDRLQKLKELCQLTIKAASGETGDLDHFMEEIKKDLGQYELDIASLPLN